MGDQLNDPQVHLRLPAADAAELVSAGCATLANTTRSTGKVINIALESLGSGSALVTLYVARSELAGVFRRLLRRSRSSTDIGISGSDPGLAGEVAALREQLAAIAEALDVELPPDP